MKPQKKTNKKFKGQKNQKPKKPINSTWETVKIAGNVVNEDGCGLEGFIGLEVLNDYDIKLVAKEKKKRPAASEEVKKTKKQKIDRDFECHEYNRFDDEEASNNQPVKKQKSKADKKKNDEKVTKKSEPGQFVRIQRVVTETKVNKSQKKKSKNQIQTSEVEAPNEESIEMDFSHWQGLGVPEDIMKALLMNRFTAPTEIQALTLPAAILGRKDILGAAETGSGKTLAFGIPLISGILALKKQKSNQNSILSQHEEPILTTNDEEENNKESHDMLDNAPPPLEELDLNEEDLKTFKAFEKKSIASNRPLYALVLTPTRELAVQVRDHLKAIAKYCGIQVAAVFGGMAQVKQERLLSRCPEIVVATPGRLWELIQEGNKHLSKIDDINFLVIDETDRMVEKGHFEELKLLIQRLNQNEEKKKKRQNFVFSATLTLVHELPDFIKKKTPKKLKMTPGEKVQLLIEFLGISQPKIVDITQSTITAEKLTECRIVCEMEQKDFYLYYFLQRHPGRTIVFCNSIECVKRLAQIFALLNCQPLPLHANMIQKQRLKNLERFHKNSNGLLIATDVAARGLDIPNVQHVIHYQVPRTSENYIHRSGRTARANKEGITVLLIEPTEIKFYVKLCKILGRDEDLPLFPVSERHLSAVKERVNIARDIDRLELKVRRTTSVKGWFKKAAEDMDIIVDEMHGLKSMDDSDDDDDNLNKIDTDKDKRQLKVKRQELSRLLSKSLFPKGFSYKYPTSTGKLEIPAMTDENNQNAVSVMKQAIEDVAKEKQLRKKKKKSILTSA